ncbi:MAG: transporter [Labilithrix sp.]|nr:transporter [Labilithrix sp.]
MRKVSLLAGALVLALALTLPARAYGAPPLLPLPDAGPVVTRSAALERLRRENLGLLAARHRLDQSRADVITAGLWQNPNLNVNGLFLTHGAVTGGNEEITIGVDQVIPLGGQAGARRDLARGLLGADERAYAANVWDVTYDAREAYVELQRAQARWRIVRAALGDLARVEGIVTERANAGANAPYDRIRVNVERSKVEGRLAEVETELLVARAALALAIGPSIDARTVTVEDALDDTPAAPTPADLEALVKRALEGRPDVASARRRAEAGDLRIAAARRSVVPSPDVGVGYTRFIDVPGSLGLSGGAMVASLSVPIPVLDRGQGSVARSRAVASEDRVRRDEVELTVRREVERAAGAMAVRVATWRRYRDTTAPEVDRLRAIGELSYREGKASILELLDAYNAYLDAQERRVTLQTEAVKATLDLERAVGPGRARD